MVMCGRPSGIEMAVCWSPSLPQATGPMPGSSAAPMTIAPAPSAKMTAVARSVRSVTSVSRSTPMMSALRIVPTLIESVATPQRVAEARAPGVEVEGARAR